MTHPSNAGSATHHPVSRGLIRQAVVVIILPLTLLVLVIAFGSLLLHQQAMRDLVGQRDERTARSVARAIGEQFEHRLATIKGIAVRLSEGTSPAAIVQSADDLLPDFEAGLALYSSDGVLLAATKDNRIMHRPALSEVLTQSRTRPAFSRPFMDSLSKEVFMLVAVPNATAIMAVGGFSVTELIQKMLADAFVSGDQASAFVLDATYQPVYQTGLIPPPRRDSEHPGVAEALRGESGTTYMRTADGSEHVVAYSPIAPVGWALLIEEEWVLVDSPLLHATLFAPLVVIPPFLLALLALWFILRQVVRPLQTLSARAAELAGGHFEAIDAPAGGVAEIRHLQAELVRMAHKVKAAQESLHDYISAITTAQEEERRRIARELHDDTLQALIALNQRIQLTRLSLTGSMDAHPLTEIGHLTEQTIGNLRRLTRALRPVYLEDLGLVTALDMLARETSQSLNLPVTFRQSGQERRLTAEVELALYRMAQEALSNAARHARASQAILTIQFAPEQVTMMVTDNGHGFKVPESPTEFALHGHFGLLGLYERADLIDAQLHLQSSPGQGTQVKIAVPTS